MSRPHKKLNIWEDVMRLIEEIYKVTSKFPKEETYGIVSQMRRASVSIASNIAEGCARNTNKEKVQFLMMSRGSISELDAQLEISSRINFMDKDEYKRLSDRLDKISRMLQGLIHYCKNEI